MNIQQPFDSVSNATVGSYGECTYLDTFLSVRLRIEYVKRFDHLWRMRWTMFWKIYLLQMWCWDVNIAQPLRLTPPSCMSPAEKDTLIMTIHPLVILVWFHLNNIVNRISRKTPYTITATMCSVEHIRGWSIAIWPPLQAVVFTGHAASNTENHTTGIKIGSWYDAAKQARPTVRAKGAMELRRLIEDGQITVLPNDALWSQICVPSQKTKSIKWITVCESERLRRPSRTASIERY